MTTPTDPGSIAALRRAAREAALEAFFETMKGWFSADGFDKIPGDRDAVWLYLNNEYAVELPAAVVRELWPEWKP